MAANSILEQSDVHWKRPEHLMEPRIWYQKSGFVVRDITRDLDSFVVEHMAEYFVKNEPLFEEKKVHQQDPEGVAEMQLLWRNKFLPQRISLVVLKKDTPGANLETVSADNPPEIIGVNLLFIRSKNDTPQNVNNIFKSRNLQNIVGTYNRCRALANVFERFGVDYYLDGVGMSVAPEWRGKGIGQMLISARIELCKALSIQVTQTVFSAIQSQKVALEGGFQVLGELFYEDMKTSDGQLLFPKINAAQKKIQLMAMRIE